MQSLNTDKLKKSVTFYILFSMFIIIIIIVGTTSFAQRMHQERLSQNYSEQVSKSIKHSISHYIKDYAFRLNGLSTTTPLAQMLKEKNRKAMYKLLEPKWKLLQGSDPNFAIMNIHMKDGSSFLRMHKPESFGDKLTNIRPMVKEVHASHKMVSGYEVGKYGADFRIIKPLFDKDKNYIGALELGLKPNFILDAIRDTNGFCGLLFIKNEGGVQALNTQYPLIRKYRLHSSLTSELKGIYEEVEKKNIIKNNMEIFTNDKKYISHLYTLNDFQGHQKIKIMFFQDISQVGYLRQNLLLGILALLFISIIPLALFIYRYIGIYQKHIEEIYTKQLNKLDESENRFRLLYEKAPEAYQSLDSNGNIVIINSKWTEELGYSKEEVIGKHFSTFLSPECKEKFLENFPKFKEAGHISGIQFDMICKNKECINVSFTGRVVNDENGEFLQTHCIFMNVTQQNKLNAEIAFNRRYLQTIFDFTPNILITTDGREINSANPAMLEFFNYKDIQTFKQEHDCVCDFFLGDKECLHAVMDGKHWLEYIHEHTQDIHKVCMLKEGKRHRFLVWAKPLDLDQHKRSVVNFMDVTELEEIRERYEFALNGSKDGLWDWDLINNSIYFSPRWKKMLGYQDDELENKFETWEERVHPDDLDGAKKAIIDNHHNRTESYENIHRLKHKDGHWVWILDRGQTIFNTDNRAVRMVGYHTDITKQKLLENKLRNSKEQFDLFMENIPAGIVIKDHNNHVIYSNNFIQKLTKEDSLVGQDAYDIFPKATVQKFKELNEKAKTEGYAEEIIEFKNFEDKPKFIRALTFSMKQDHGELNTGSIYIDITDKYKDQHKIVQLQAAVESAPISIIITDLFGRIEYVNPWFIKLTGYTKEESIGTKPNILKSGYTSSKEYTNLWKTITQREVWSGTFKNIKKDGTEFWEAAIISPIFDDKGEIINFIGIKQEITEQVYLKEELIKQAQKSIELGAILEEIANEVYIFSKEKLQFLYVNKEVSRNLQYSSSELMQMTPMDIKFSLTKDEFENTLKQFSQENTKKIYLQIKHQRKDGTIYPADSYLQETQFEGQDAYMAIVIDTTEQTKIRQELLNQEEIMIAQSRHAAMGEMIGMIAHQWRQPITVIAMGANNILADIELDEVNEEQFKEQANSIIKQTMYLSRTIDDFRNFFRPNKEMELVKLEDVMIEADKIIGKSLEDNAITLEIIHDNGYKIQTYSRELLQVYINILKNAKEALVETRQKERHIRVNISDDDKNIITTICDNAGGIDSSIIDKIFDPYFSTKDEKSGTGLGLYMSKTIIEKHLHGSINVKNSEEGTCFTITLAKRQDDE